jgi:hypothetical protein
MLGSAQVSYRDTAENFIDAEEAAREIPFGANDHMEAHGEEREDLPSRLVSNQHQLPTNEQG